jgi:hypothetical protein
MSCTWCQKSDEHGPEIGEECDDYDEFCNHCEFCEANICCICWDRDDVCYYPGEGYCPTCKFRLEKCPDCVLYMKGLMSYPEVPMCEKHWDRDSLYYVGKN